MHRFSNGTIRRTWCLLLGVVGGPLAVAPVSAQSATTSLSAVTREAAIAGALARSPLVGLATADRAAATAASRGAQQWENPVFGASYSKSAPQQHYTLDVPLDPWWQRTPRIAAARASQTAANVRFTYAVRSLAFEADTAYTRAQLANARRQLSTRTARDADSLVVLARLRRDAGDASELDVELARVFAGQARNAAGADSISERNAVLVMQTLMGIAVDSTMIVIADSLTLEPSASSAGVARAPTPLLLDAATRDLRAAELRVDAERQRRFGAPSLTLGVETVNPGGPGGPLALAGVSMPLPLFNRNEAAVLQARADLSRAQSQLALTQLATSAAMLAARRDDEAARSRATRSAQLVASANRIVALSLLAYREGASTLLVVLEAQRTARETLAQYYDDVAASRVATSLVRLLSTPAPESRP